MLVIIGGGDDDLFFLRKRTETSTLGVYRPAAIRKILRKLKVKFVAYSPY